jgi:hypothetical protein
MLNTEYWILTTCPEPVEGLAPDSLPLGGMRHAC